MPERIGSVIIKDFVRRADGSCSFTFDVDDAEAEVLMKFAIKYFIDQGLIAVDDQGYIEDELDSYLDSGGKLS